MVFQQYALFPHMSIYDNVAFGLKVKRVPRREHDERVREMLRVVELEGLRAPAAAPALRRPAAARRAGARARQPAGGAAARRAARRARRQAAQADAARAEAHPARARHDVRLRDARPGRGAGDVGPDRRHERRPRRADRGPARDLRASADRVRRRLHRLAERARADRRRGRRRVRGDAGRRGRAGRRRLSGADTRSRRRDPRRGPARAVRIEPPEARGSRGRVAARGDDRRGRVSSACTRSSTSTRGPGRVVCHRLADELLRGVRRRRRGSRSRGRPSTRRCSATRSLALA